MVFDNSYSVQIQYDWGKNMVFDNSYSVQIQYD